MRQEGRDFMTWTFMKTERAQQEWWDYGNRLTHIGLFDFLVPDDTGKITGTIPAADIERVHRWPHIVHLLTVRNDGIGSRFTAIVNNTNGAQDLFISELHRILDLYPFAAGVDIDLEVGPLDNVDGVVALAQRIHENIKARSAQNFVAWCLPPMTGDSLPWWERWCDYSRMEPYFDTCAIMSYAFAWAGSAAGPINPLWWMEDIYDYAVTRIPKEKIFLGIPGFAFSWRLHRYYSNEPPDYRGLGMTFLGALGWQQGQFRFHDEQPYIPTVGFLDEDSQSPFALPHVYETLEGIDAAQTVGPVERFSNSIVGRVLRNLVVTYEKTPKYEFIGQIVNRAGDAFDEVAGAMTLGDGWIAPRQPQIVEVIINPGDTAPTIVWESEGVAIFNFVVPTSGVYDLVVRVNFPWWNCQILQLELAGIPIQVGPFPDWHPLHRRLHWFKAHRLHLSAGEHTLRVLGEGSQYGTQFWGFRVCSQFNFAMFAGEAIYNLAPRRLKDINNNWVLPPQFVLTSEVLRSAPEHAWVWYDDFRENTFGYYALYGGTWSINTDPKRRVLIQSNVTSDDAQAYLPYYQFGDLSIRARLRMTAGSGTMGVVFRARGTIKTHPPNDLYLFLLRQSTQTAELWHRIKDKTGDIWTRLQPDITHRVQLNRWHTLRVRNRGSELHCWVDDVRVFNVTATLPAQGGFGIRSSLAAIECGLLDVGDPYVYVPQEAIDVVLPDGQVQEFGRIPRTGVTWIQPWEYFRFDGPGEESTTRQEEIPLDFDYFHTNAFAAFDSDRTAVFRIRDRGMLLTWLFLGDARGFSMAHYSDAEHFDMLANLAKHKWGLKGVCLWGIGQQDPLVFKYRKEVV